MKKACALLIGLFFLGWGISAFAGTPTTTQSSAIHIETTYNAYGVALSSTSTTTTVTTTSRETLVNGQAKTITSTSKTVQTVTSSWRGGSLKADTARGTAITSGDDGSSSTTEFWTDYSYDDKGRLKGATGGANTTGNRGKDAKDQPLGTSSSSTVDTYDIRNGVALKVKSETTGQNFGVDGQKTSDFRETSTSTYEIVGGSWQIMSETSVSLDTEIDGSTTATTTVKTYTRNENGVIAGITQTKTGEMKKATGEKGDLTSAITYTIQNYVATFTFDPQQGWYLSNESYDWKTQESSNNNNDANDLQTIAAKAPPTTTTPASTVAPAPTVTNTPQFTGEPREPRH